MDIAQLTDSYFIGAIVAGLILAAFVTLAILLRLILAILTKRANKDNTDRLLVVVVGSIKGPVVLLVVTLGLLFGYFTISRIQEGIFTSLNGTSEYAFQLWQVAAILIATFTISHLADRTIKWYLRNVAMNTATTLDDTLLPIFRRVLPLTVYAVGGLVAIDNLGISISPILAGLGIGGLAVALAVQPTLSNFFAGTYVVTEGELKTGDFIELDGGPSGYVESVGWRSTKIRTRFNNLVIIPNSRMAESIVTNYFSPTPAMNIIVTCGVSYESDLSHVETIALEEAASLIKESSHSVKNAEPFFGFSNFGDSNVDFYIFLQAVDRQGTFTLKSELMKRIHSRFASEGIEINYPVRRLVLPEEFNPEGFIVPAKPGN
ncbi:MAG: Small-conductance mechanosensitive channel [Chloroflexi bacterium]|jgi:small-conductance mechanosensitive channel|nr:MAG: Small-conductance mechanosensitive channel [Chloroflexota bacterium]